jgi:demethylmenaquinone methyltransferase / 2-methoxy-6-polyprenyl-1,4-benzoquinol methylase
MSRPRPPRRAEDGSPYPERGAPGFERDVQAMFAHIAHGYDWFDHLASLGQDYLWRPRALWSLDRFRGGRRVARMLDVGCGPGEFTRLAVRHLRSAEAFGLDLTPAMLREARRLLAPTPEGSRIRLVRGDAQRLPFAAGRFDLVLSGFVARNLPDLAAAYREFHRVLRPGGTVLTLEITEPVRPVMAGLFHAYFDHVVPWLGTAVGSAGPYRYLPESLRYLPDRSGMIAHLTAAGFARAEAHPQSGGIVTTYLAEVPAKP